jgi:hypothetical protein
MSSPSSTVSLYPPEGFGAPKDQRGHAKGAAAATSNIEAPIRELAEGVEKELAFPNTVLAIFHWPDKGLREGMFRILQRVHRRLAGAFRRPLLRRRADQLVGSGRCPADAFGTEVDVMIPSTTISPSGASGEGIVEILWNPGVPVGKVMQPHRVGDLPQLVSCGFCEDLEHPMYHDPTHPSAVLLPTKAKS